MAVSPTSWQVEVDDDLDVWQVHTSGHQIGRDDAPELQNSHFFEGKNAFCLALFSVEEDSLELVTTIAHFRSKMVDNEL